MCHALRPHPHQCSPSKSVARPPPVIMMCIFQFNDVVTFNRPEWPSSFDQMFSAQANHCKSPVISAAGKIIKFSNLDGSTTIGDDAAIIKLNFAAPSKDVGTVLVVPKGQSVGSTTHSLPSFSLYRVPVKTTRYWRSTLYHCTLEAAVYYNYHLFMLPPRECNEIGRAHV